MLYARVVLGLPVEGPFDYIIPEEMVKKIKVGARVKVSFGPRKMIGYVTGLANKTKIKNLKKILELIDEEPILDKNMLKLAKEVSEYYCCSWGEAIETAIPESLRKGRKPEAAPLQSQGQTISAQKPPSVLLHDLGGEARWDIYLSEIKSALEDNKSALVLLPDIESVLRVKELINARLGVDPALLYRKQPQELEAWFNIKQGKSRVAVSTRSGVFAPLPDLGLAIIDSEENSVYKQDQVPHYHAREVALMRTKYDNLKLILGSNSPSLESFYLGKKKKLNFMPLSRKSVFPEVKIFDLTFRSAKERKRSPNITKQLEDSTLSVLNQKGKILLFLNRKGFATFASCHNCGKILKCERCNINLVYYFSQNLLKCHYCNFKMELPKICPSCNSGYIKFSGTGTEKIESELYRIFPQARIKRLAEAADLDLAEADIFVATSAIFKQPGLRFDLVCVLGIDNSLNRVDFRSSEKTFSLLSSLAGITDKKMIIETYFPNHYCFEALIKNDANIFYEKELKARKQLNFPPYKHLALVKLRAKAEEKVKAASQELFQRLNQCSRKKNIRILSVNPGQPPKLRGNYYWTVLAASVDARKLSAFLKLNLKSFSRSGIIVTVDVDPI